MTRAVTASGSNARPCHCHSGPTNIGGNRWLVDHLVAFRISAGAKAGDIHRKGTNLYKVRWQGCNEDEDSWEPESKIAAALIEAYHARHPRGVSSGQSHKTPSYVRVDPGCEALTESLDGVFDMMLRRHEYIYCSAALYWSLSVTLVT